MNLKKQAANRLIFVLSFFLIAGCKPGNPSEQPEKISRFDGVYICSISKSFNQIAIEQKNKHVFPSVLTKTTKTKSAILDISNLIFLFRETIVVPEGKTDISKF